MLKASTAKWALALAGLGAVAALGYAAYVTYDLHRDYAMPDESARAGVPLLQRVARGHYVADAADCVACHTVEGGRPFAGGYAIATPFGEIVSSNITPDPQTGIGGWTLGQFDRAVRHGKGSHGYLYPAMPYPAYARMTDADVRDLWAYLRTVQPVRHAVAENRLRFPFDQRWLMSGWNLLFFRPHVFHGDPAKSAQYNRGAYLVNGPEHCAACHTGKNPLGGDSAACLQGGALDGWYAPDLTPNARTGLGRWSVDDIVAYLKTGATGKAVAAGPMTEAIEDSTQYLTDDDLRAIAVYLKGQPPSATNAPAPLAAGSAAMALGKRVYESQCTACHVSSGAGVREMMPALAANPTVQAGNPATLLHMVLEGGSGPQTLTNPTGAGMPRFDWRLSDEQVAAVLTYIRNAWGNAAPAVGAAEVRKARAAAHAHSPLSLPG